MPYTPIVATLGYVLSADRQHVLMIHRNARPDDPALGKYNGLGGKMYPVEDVAQCMRRELREEAGIEAHALQLRGVVSWPGFGKAGEDWLGFIFLITAWSGTPIKRNPEGELDWIPLQRLLDACHPNLETRQRANLPLWPGDMYFVPLVFDDNPRVFYGVMPYRDGTPVGWSVTRL